MYLEFYHGRKDPKEDVDGWGFQGPVFGPYDTIHTTYALHIRCSLGRIDYGMFPIVEGCVEFNGAYYGDWVVHATLAQLPPNTRRNNRLTKKILSTQPKKLPLLISHEMEWVRLYAAYKLKEIGNGNTKDTSSPARAC